MGVACELYRQEWSDAAEWHENTVAHSDSGGFYRMIIFKLPYINWREESAESMILPPRVIYEYYGLTSGNVDDIIGMNDKTSSDNFPEIADYIEYEMEGTHG